MSGRADKGIIITTGTFTAEAKRESTRDGAPPIELIDGEKLIDMLEKLELGLKAVTTFEVEHGFKEFQDLTARLGMRRFAPQLRKNPPSHDSWEGFQLVPER